MRSLIPALSVLAMGLIMQGCITTGTDQYKAVDDFNTKVAAHKIVSIELDDGGKVKKIEFAGSPQFMRPQNQWVEGIKAVIPIIGAFTGSGGVTVPTLEAGRDIFWADGSNNNEDHRTATGGEYGTITGPSDSHDATSTPTVVNQPDPIIITQPEPIIVETKTID